MSMIIGAVPSYQAASQTRATFCAKPDLNIPDDEVMFSSTNNEKVSFGEGAKLVGKGFAKKIGNMIKTIVKHPVKTALTMGGTALLIAGAPIVGLTSATAASALALGFAGVAVGKTAKDFVETVKDSRAGRHDEVREDLMALGGDGVDLALTLPFAPKAVNQISRFTKYGKGTVGLNRELLSNLKNAKDFSGVRMELAKADTSIVYEMLGNEMGLAVKPKLAFKDIPLETGMGGAYEPTTGELQVNQNILTGKAKMIAKSEMGDIETVLRHELEHFRQFSDIARTENIGIEGLGNTITKYYSDIRDKFSLDNIEEGGFSRATVENMLDGDKSVLNRKLYQDVIDSRGTIKAGTHEAEMAAKYAEGLIEKVNPKPKNIAAFEEAIKDVNTNPLLQTRADRMKIINAQMDLYKANILEKEAYAVQDEFIANVVKRRPDMAKDLLMADAIINKGTDA